MSLKAFGKRIPWTDESKIGLLGRCAALYVRGKNDPAFDQTNIMPTVKHGDVCGCFATSGPGHVAVIVGTMNSAVDQKIVKDNVRQSENRKGADTFSQHWRLKIMTLLFGL